MDLWCSWWQLVITRRAQTETSPSSPSIIGGSASTRRQKGYNLPKIDKGPHRESHIPFGNSTWLLTMAVYHWFTSQKDQKVCFSIATLVYQKVTQNITDGFSMIFHGQDPKKNAPVAPVLFRDPLHIQLQEFILSDVFEGERNSLHRPLVSYLILTMH